MPAVKMKRTSSEDRLRHKLHPIRKCTKASKGSQDKEIHQTDLLTALIQTPDEVNSTMEGSLCDRDSAEDNDFHEYFTEIQAQLPNFPVLSCDPTSNGRTGSPLMSCIPVLETIFSPVLMADNSEFDPINQYKSVIGEVQQELPHLVVANDSDDGSCHSSDFLFSESLSAVLPLDDDSGIVDVVTDNCPDYGCGNNGTEVDMSERYMILPFLDQTLETINVEEAIEDDDVNSDDACLYLEIHQFKSSNQENLLNYRPGNDEEQKFFDMHFGFRDLPDLPPAETVSPVRPALLPKETRKRKPITLVLDLDETLVHSSLEHCEDADFSFPVFFSMKEHMVYVKRRPHLQFFLETVAVMFEVVVFTASQSIYAEQLLDMLDPDKNLISHRIYRESCIFADGSYTKDLTILGIDLAKVAIVDNSPQVFRLQVNNGIPIESWFDDPSDRALISLLPFLETLAATDDVRPLIAEKFGTKERWPSPAAAADP